MVDTAVPEPPGNRVSVHHRDFKCGDQLSPAPLGIGLPSRVARGDDFIFPAQQAALGTMTLITAVPIRIEAMTRADAETHIRLPACNG